MLDDSSQNLQESLLSCAPNLTNATELYAGEPEKCIDHILGSQVLLQAFFNSNRALKKNVLAFSQHQEKILNAILSQPNVFQACCKDGTELSIIMDAYPAAFQEKIFDAALNNPVVFQACFKDSVALRLNIAVFPAYQEKMLEAVLSNPVVFQPCFADKLAFRKNMTSSPQYQEKMLEAVLSNTAVFKACFADSLDLRTNMEAFPAHQGKILDAVLSNPIVFQSCFADNIALEQNVGAFPAYQEKMLDAVLSNPIVFRACFAIRTILEKNVAAFPKFAARMRCLYTLGITPLGEFIKEAIQVHKNNLIELNLILQNQQGKYLIDKAEIDFLKELKKIIISQLLDVKESDLREKLNAILKSIAALLTPAPTLQHATLTFFAKVEQQVMLDSLIAAKKITQDCIDDIKKAKANPVALRAFFNMEDKNSKDSLPLQKNPNF